MSKYPHQSNPFYFELSGFVANRVWVVNVSKDTPPRQNYVFTVTRKLSLRKVELV